MFSRAAFSEMKLGRKWRERSFVCSIVHSFVRSIVSSVHSIVHSFIHSTGTNMHSSIYESRPLISPTYWSAPPTPSPAHSHVCELWEAGEGEGRDGGQDRVL